MSELAARLSRVEHFRDLSFEEVREVIAAGSLRSYRSGGVTYIGSVGVGLVYPNARLKIAHSSRFVRELVEWRPDVVHSQCEFSTFFLAKRIVEPAVDHSTAYNIVQQRKREPVGMKHVVGNTAQDGMGLRGIFVHRDFLR